MSGHVMRWTYDNGSVEGRAVCLAPPDADCRLTSTDCQCEEWGLIVRRDDGTIWHTVTDLEHWNVPEWHQVVPGDACNVELFINESGCAEEMTPHGERYEFAIGETPFETVWESDGCSWRPVGGSQ